MSANTDSQSSLKWVREACELLVHGFTIVPVDPLGGVSRDEEDPVVQNLGRNPKINRIVGGASTESEVRRLGEVYEEASVAALTGIEPDLLAVQFNKAQGWDEDPFYRQIASVTDSFQGFTSGTREYVLLPHPHVEEPLPAITEKNGTVLHGEDSLIHLPGGRFQWRDRFYDSEKGHVKRGERRRLAREIIGMYGLEDHLAPEETPGKEASASTRSTGRSVSHNGQEDDSDRETQLNLPLDSRSGSGSGRDSLFRSGDQLRRSSRNPSGRLNLPWTVPGGLSVLTGPSKVAGKSSWVLNLALHLSSGEPFLGYENPPSEVILLADTSPANLRELLAQVSFVDREDMFSRLHVLHSSDVVRENWASTLSRAYSHVSNIDADLLIVDCLDRYIRLKGGDCPTMNEEVIHKLTAQSPPDCPMLIVKSTDCTPGESMSTTIDRLGLLGVSADAILRMDDISTEAFPCLRRLATVSRRGAVSQTHLCSLRSGQYVRVRRSDLSGFSTKTLSGGPVHKDVLTGRGTTSDPLLPS
jgi:hypothetical protein